MKDTEFYRERGFEDASKWLRILEFNGIRMGNLLEADIKSAADFYSNETFRNDYPKTCLNEELQKSYRNAFLSGVNNIKKSAGISPAFDKEKKIDLFEKKGHVEAARWIASVGEDYVQGLNEEELTDIADTIFNIRFHCEKDLELRTAFVNAFMEEVELLISSVD